jgi:hypothetical protein
MAILKHHHLEVAAPATSWLCGLTQLVVSLLTRVACLSEVPEESNSTNFARLLDRVVREAWNFLWMEMSGLG